MSDSNKNIVSLLQLDKDASHELDEEDVKLLEWAYSLVELESSHSRVMSDLLHEIPDKNNPTYNRLKKELQDIKHEIHEKEHELLKGVKQ